MNKTAIKNFAIWARNKLIKEITYKAGLVGVTENGIAEALPQSNKEMQWFNIGTSEHSSIQGEAVKQREKLVQRIREKEKESDYKTAYTSIIEEVAYTWFNRLIAIRFMEVNDYLPSRVRVLSSETAGKEEPDLVTSPFDSDLEFTSTEQDLIMQYKDSNQLDELFRMLFIRQCNKLNEILPELFEKMADYTELLLNISYTDKDGVVYHLTHDIDTEDFCVRENEEGEVTGQIEIIGWLYQYYNTEPKDEAFALLKKNIKVTKERIPAVTQLFTPEWIVKYMVENSLGRLWVEGHPDEQLKKNWKHYLEEVEQEEDVEKQLEVIREDYRHLKPVDIKVIDPCMGSGHILIYTFEVLMQIYEANGYSQRDAAKSILENNIYGLDIDNRAYQLSYFALMMKARQYNRRILASGVKPHIFAIKESNSINRGHLEYFGHSLEPSERKIAIVEITEVLDAMRDAMEYGSIIDIKTFDKELMMKFLREYNTYGQMSFETVGIEETQKKLQELIKIAYIMSQKYEVAITNPPYMGNMPTKMAEYTRCKYPISKYDLYSVFMERCQSMLVKNGFYSMINQQTWMFLSSFEQLRDKVLNLNLINMSQLGPRAFEEISGEVVQTTVFVIRNTSLVEDYKSIFIDLTEASTQKEEAFFKHDKEYATKIKRFRMIPGYTFAYWIKEKVIDHFKQKMLSDYAVIKAGIVTGNNEYFLKFWFEVNSNNICYAHKKFVDTTNIKWVPMHKGGSYRKYYGNHEYIMNLHDIWDSSKTSVAVRRGDPMYYFREGLTWSTLANNLSVRLSPTGFVFDTKGSMCFIDDKANLLYIEGLLNSKVTAYFMKFLSPTLDFNQGAMGKMPVIIDNEYIEEISKLVNDNNEIAKEDWDSLETSWDFKKHALITDSHVNCKIYNAYELYKSQVNDAWNKIKYNEEEINKRFIEIYKLNEVLSPCITEKDVSIVKIDLQRDIRTLISYAIGCILGRYSLDQEGLIYAGGKWDNTKYTSLIPAKDNVLLITEDEFFTDDIVNRFIGFVKSVYGEETLEENLDFIASALGNKGNTSREVIRNYFIKDFYKDHCKTYQKRPIYWMFDSGKQNGFKAIIYMHRYNADTIGNLRIDYLHRLQKVYESEIARMQDIVDNSNNARESATAAKRRDKLVKQLQETKDYDQKIAHLALARTEIDLDDGVKVNYEKVQTGTDGKKLEVLAKI